MAKQSEGKKGWRPSQNLAKPEKEVTDQDEAAQKEKPRFSASANLDKPWSRTNDHKFSRREVERLAKAPPDPAYWAKKYPGYTLIGGAYGYKAVYSELRGWGLYLKLRKTDEKGRRE